MRSIVIVRGGNSWIFAEEGVVLAALGGGVETALKKGAWQIKGGRGSFES